MTAALQDHRRRWQPTADDGVAVRAAKTHARTALWLLWLAAAGMEWALLCMWCAGYTTLLITEVQLGWVRGVSVRDGRRAGEDNAARRPLVHTIHVANLPRLPRRCLAARARPRQSRHVGLFWTGDGAAGAGGRVAG